jgi:hypothetical protein
MVTLKKNTEALIDTRKEVGLELNIEKTKYMLLYRHQSARKNHYTKIAKRPFETVAQFKYLGTIVTNQHSGGN